MYIYEPISLPWLLCNYKSKIKFEKNNNNK